MIKLNRWLDKPEHRILSFLIILVLLSWLVCIPEIQLGQYLSNIKSMRDLTNLTLIKDSTFVTRIVAHWLDKTLLLANLTSIIKISEILFLSLLVLLSYKDKNHIYISYGARILLLIQAIMHLLLLYQLFKLTQITDPNHALALIKQLALIYQVLGFISLFLCFILFVLYIVKLGANSLHA